MGFAGAGWAEEADVAALLDPGELREVQDEWSLRRGLGRPVEVLEALHRGEAGRADARAGAGGVAGEDLGLEQRFEKPLVGPGLAAGTLSRVLESLKHPRRL